MKKWILCIAFLMHSLAQASVTDFVVKVFSQGGGQNDLLEGSGILVKHQQSVYVLTSEHVVLHDNVISTHHFILDGGTSQSMTYVNSDWGMGLALMQISGQILGLTDSSQLPDLDALASTVTPAVRTSVMSAGFPYNSKGLLVDTQGVVHSTTEISNALVNVPQMLEVEGAHGEFGMSGGAILSSDQTVLGILSDETPDPVNKILYAIPISMAAKWALNLINDPNAKPTLLRTTFDMNMMGGNQVRNGHLIVSYWPALDPDPNQIQIGYDNNLQKPGITPPTNTFTDGIWGEIYQSIAPLLTDGMDNGRYPMVTIKTFRPRELLQYKNMIPVSGLVSFFRSLQDPSLKPLALFSYQGQPDPIDAETQEDSITQSFPQCGYEAGGLLAQYLAAIQDLAYNNEDNYPAGRHYPMEALNKADLDFVLNAPALAADWAAFHKVDVECYGQVQSVLTALGADLTAISL